MARAKYNRQLKDYCALLHMSVSGLNKFIARGKQANPPELPPLDRPELMAEWYRRHYQHAPPPRLLELAEGPPTPESAPITPTRAQTKAESSPAEAPAAPQRKAVDMSAIEGMDLVTAADRQRRKVAAEWFAYDAAQRDPAITQQSLKTIADRYDSAVASLAAIETKVTEAEIKRGERPTLSDIRAELGPIVAQIAFKFTDTLVERCGVPRDRAAALTDECLRDLLASRFGPPLSAAA